jgi:hypothetical protein
LAIYVGPRWMRRLKPTDYPVDISIKTLSTMIKFLERRCEELEIDISLGEMSPLFVFNSLLE